MSSAALKLKLTSEVKSIFEENLLSGYSKWKNTNYKFICPATKEYTFQWLWDTAFHAIVLSNFDTKWAKSEISNFLIGQQDDGFIPHVIFWGDSKILPHWGYIESRISPRPRTTAITQPPALALAVEEIYNKDPDKQFLESVLPKLAKFHRWLLENRDPDGDHLLSIISPNESGMDELPVFQVVSGYTGTSSAKLRYYFRKPDLLNKRYRFNSKTILDKDYFNVEEILFNCVFIEASRSLSRLFAQLGNSSESLFFEQAALKSEKSLLEKCWDPKEQIFYSLYSKHENMAKVKTIASLLPLFLEGLEGNKLNSLVEKHLLNSEEFWTSYPVPSVAKSEPFYNPAEPPEYKMKLLWRGPTWLNTNWFIIRGLRKHKFDKIADAITKKTVDMVLDHGFREYYNPETGQGYRRQNFGWSTLVLDLVADMKEESNTENKASNRGSKQQIFAV